MAERGRAAPAGYRHRHRRRRGWLAAAVALVLLVTLAGGGAAAWRLEAHARELQTRLAADLRSGEQGLEAGKTLLTKATAERRPDLLVQARSQFSFARTRFQLAGQRANSDQTMRRAEWIPVVGGVYVSPRIKTIDQLSAMGVELSEAALLAAQVDEPLVAPETGGQESVGKRLEAFIKSSLGLIVQLEQHLTRASDAASGVDASLLPSGQRALFEQVRRSLSEQQDGIQAFLRLGPAILDVLGANGPRTYLVVQADNASLQGSGGYVGSYSLLSSRGGEVKLAQSSAVDALDIPYPHPGEKGYIPEPGPLRQWTGDHGWRLGDSLFSPDFATAARASEQLYANESHNNVDGVIAVDPIAIADLLAVTGPQKVPGTGETVQSKDFADVVFQREEFRGTPGHPGYGYDGKKFVVAAAGEVLNAILHVQPAQWPSLIAALNKAVAERHLQFYFNGPPVQARMQEVGWSGELVPSHGSEFLAEVEDNYGDSKSNHFIKRRFDLTLTVQDGLLHHHLVMDIENPTPPGYAGGQQYWAYVRLYVPLKSTERSTRGLVADKVPNSEAALPGTAFMDGWIYVDPPRSGPARVQVSFDWSTQAGDLKKPYTVYWRKQAGTLADPLGVSFSAGGRTWKAAGDLGQDRLLTLRSDGLTIGPGRAVNGNLPFVAL